MKKTKQYGLVLDPIVIGQDYILGGYGSLGGEILQPTGQWLDYLPAIESQVNAAGFDPLYCASEGTENALAMLAKRIYGQSRNWSGRYIAKVSETTRQGNSPHKTAEAIRKSGAPNEVDWPFLPTIKSWEEFYADIPRAIHSLAVAFLNEFDFKHEYVVTQPYYLKQALQHSPLGISVAAWFKGDDGLYYKPAGMQDNHWCVLVGYKENDYWLVFDSYNVAGQGDESYIKKVKWDTPFQVAKRYSLTRQVANEQSWLQYLIVLVKAAFGIPDPAPVVTIDHSPPTIPPAPAPEPKFKWNNTYEAKMSVRKICDEEGLTLHMKDILTACVAQESGFQNYYFSGPKKGQPVKNENKKNGKVWSTDWGIVQINDTKGWHIGPGLPFSSVQDVMDNPEKAVRYMARLFKAGKAKLWSSYSTGAYKKWL